MNTATQEYTLTLPWVEAATSHFVNAQDMREAFSLAMAAGLNLIFSGPGGHGKSEFLEAAMGAIQDVNPYVKSFGQGTSPEELYGGLDLDALNRQGGAEKAAIQYNPELSFLACPVAVFEELFDAPSRVLTSLKDTLTARELRNGHQRFKMITRVIAAATNHSPQEIAEGGPEIAALIERFPIQLEVKWSHYTEDSFTELFAAVTGDKLVFEKINWSDVAALQEQVRNVTFSPLMQRMLARIIVELRRDGVVVSPRTAVLAMQLAKAAAVINGRNRASAQDINAIAFLPGAHALKSRISDLVKECVNSMAGEEELDKLEEVLAEAADFTAVTENDFEGLLQILKEVHDKVTSLKLGTHQISRRQTLLGKLRPIREKAQQGLTVFEVARKREEHKKLFAEFEQMISRFGKDVRYGDATKRADAMTGLQNTKRHLNGMNIHTELEAQRSALLMKIQLAGVS
jgi:MoxR-like ATPase